MRELLISICPVTIWVIAAGETAIAVALFLLAKRRKQTGAILGGLITVGLIIDAMIMGLGTILPSGTIFAVSPIRFIAHGLLIPLIFPICGYALKFKKPAMVGVRIFTALLMIAGLAQALATKLELKEFAGVIRCAAAEGTPAWAEYISYALSFGAVLPLLMAGIIILIKRKKPYLFLSGFFMFAFSALGPATGNTDLIFFISLFGEILMVLFMYFTFLAEKKEES
ncbi:MAG: hypothetical protein J5626_06950 [Lachnospiraceae bacterium]|nr:hypothetical protein [Lachnospiraceae bacterium]